MHITLLYLLSTPQEQNLHCSMSPICHRPFAPKSSSFFQIKIKKKKSHCHNQYKNGLHAQSLVHTGREKDLSRFGAYFPPGLNGDLETVDAELSLP